MTHTYIHLRENFMKDLLKKCITTLAIPWLGLDKSFLWKAQSLSQSWSCQWLPCHLWTRVWRCPQSISLGGAAHRAGLWSVTGSPEAHRWTGRRTWEYNEDEEKRANKTTIWQERNVNLRAHCVICMFYNYNVLLGIVLWSKPWEIEPLLFQVGIEAFLDVI